MPRAKFDSHKLQTIGLLATLLPALCIAAEPPQYSVQELDNLPGGYAGYSSSVNSFGEVVGDAVSADCSAGCAVLWRGGVPSILENNGNQYAGDAYSINEAGQITGVIGSSSGQQAVVWNDSSLTVLPPPTQYKDSVGYALNDAGEVVGSASNPTGRPFAALVWHGATPLVLGLPTDYGSAYALGVNSAGTVVGNVCCDGGDQAAIWHGATPTLLAKIGRGADFGGEAVAINQAGLIVGHVYHSSDFVHAAAWAGRKVTDLGTLAKGTRSEALAVNDRGVIVGESDSLQAAQMHAVLWSQSGASAQDLNDLISVSDAGKVLLQKATSINDACTIVADGADLVTAQPRVFVLTLIDPAHCGD